MPMPISYSPFLRLPTHMSSKRNPGGCWTCRLRRKKCNGTHPVCGECKNLCITYYCDAERPEWLNRGAKQKKVWRKVSKRVSSATLHINEAAIPNLNNRLSSIIETNSTIESPQSPRNLGRSAKVSVANPNFVARVANLAPMVCRSSVLPHDAAASEHLETAFTTNTWTTCFPFFSHFTEHDDDRLLDPVPFQA
jgi:hypothetical protein